MSRCSGNRPGLVLPMLRLSVNFPFFDAIKRDSAGKVEVSSQDCPSLRYMLQRFPSSAIKSQYYTYDNLSSYVKQALEKTKNVDTLVLMCRGNPPSTGEVQDIFKEQGLKVGNYFALRLPCAGRVPTDFVFEALNLGVKNPFHTVARGIRESRYGRSASTYANLRRQKSLRDLRYRL